MNPQLKFALIIAASSVAILALMLAAVVSREKLDDPESEIAK